MLKKLFPQKTPIDKARYEIEKTYSKAIQSVYKSIEKINEDLDQLTNKSLKDFEHIERDLTQQIDALETSLDKDITNLKLNHDKDLTLKQDSLKKLEIKLSDKIKALALDFEKTKVFLEDDLLAIDEEKTITLKEIEKKYLSNTSIYEDKLSLFKKNLEKNQAETKKKFDDVLKTLNDQLHTLNTEGYKAYQTFDEQVNTLYKSYIDQLNDETTSIDTLKKDFLNDTLQLRKLLNVMMKEIDITLSKTRALIEAPFIAFSKSLSTFEQSIKGHTAKVIESINQDFEFERIRIDSPSEDATDDVNEKDRLKDIKARTKLAEARKEALTFEFTQLETLFDEENDYLKTALTHEKALLDQALDHYEATTKMIHNKLKDLFSVSENYIEAFNNDLTMYTSKDTLNDSFNALKTLFEAALGHFKDYEEIRIKAHIDYTQKRLKTSTEIDEISMFLDTLEPLKEIEISKQKIKVEQEDASIKHDIDRANLTHQLTLKKLEHETHLKQERFLNELKLKQAEHELKILIAKQDHELKKHPLLIKEKIAQINYQSKKQHLESDLEFLENKFTLEKEKLALENEIKRLTTKKEYDLSLVDLERESTEATLQQTSEIDQLKQALTIKLDQLRVQTTKEDKHIEKALNTYEKEYNQTLKDIEKNIQDVKNKHEETIRFINKALEKEIETPLAHQDDILSMAKHKVRLLNEQYSFIKKELDQVKDALKSPEVSFKRLLPLVGDAFIHDLKNTITHAYDLLKESHTFVYTVTNKQLEHLDNPRKKQTSLEKAKSDHEKIIQKIDKSKETLLNTLIERIKNAKALIKQDSSPSLQSIRSIIKPLSELIDEQTAKHQRTLKEDITALYKQLTESDTLIIKRAKENHEKAINQEIAHYESLVAPFNTLLQEKNKTHSEKLETLKQSLEEKKNTALEPLMKRIETLRIDIQEKQTQKSLYLKRFTTQEESSKKLYTDAIKLIQEEHTSSLQMLEEKTKAKKQKLTDRLDDALALYNHEKTMQEIAIENLDNLLDDKTSDLAYVYDQAHATIDETMLKLKEALESKKNQATLDLNQNLKSFEDRMLSTTPRLEQFIEEATRKLSQEASSKKQTLTYLNDQEKALRETLNQTLNDALIGLKDHLNKSLIVYTEAIASTDSTTQSIDPLIKTNDDFFDSFIKNALDSLLDKDMKG